MGRVLILSPHPDDEAIGCGGTVRTHVVAGDDVRVVFLTSGEKGIAGWDPAKAAMTREAEATAAAKLLGVTTIRFWRLPDGAVRATQQLIRQLVALLREWDPHYLYVPHAGEQHPDHRAVYRLASRALESHAIAIVRFYEVWTPLSDMDAIVDISDHIEDKIAAIRAYESQCAIMRFDEAAIGLNRYRGEMHSWPGGDYAEVFTERRA